MNKPDNVIKSLETYYTQQGVLVEGCEQARQANTDKTSCQYYPTCFVQATKKVKVPTFIAKRALERVGKSVLANLYSVR